MRKFKYNKLRGRIIEVLGSNNAFLEQIGFSKASFYSKLECKTEFTQSEISRACDILNIPYSEIHSYFFAS